MKKFCSFLFFALGVVVSSVFISCQQVQMTNSPTMRLEDAWSSPSNNPSVRRSND